MNIMTITNKKFLNLFYDNITYYKAISFYKLA